MDKAGNPIETMVGGQSSEVSTVDVTSRPASRRSFLSHALNAASGLVVGEALLSRLNAAVCPPTVTSCPSTPPPQWKPGDPLQQVTEFTSKGGRLAVGMTVTDGCKKVAVIENGGYACRPMTLRYYEGRYLDGTGPKWPIHPELPGPGPTLRVRVGDTVHVRLLNDINPNDFPTSTPNNMVCDSRPGGSGGGPIYPAGDTMPSCFHGDNVTNLHYHGTHVTPDGVGDNVMIDVVPVRTHVAVQPPIYKGTYENRFEIPVGPTDAEFNDRSKPMRMGQAPGTHWYHAHKHGSVSLQLLNGMAGALVIEGPFDDQLETLIPGLRKTEKVLVIQQIGDVVYIQPDSKPLQTGVSSNPPYPLPIVNGQVQPTITMAPGEIQRWRFVNATMSQTTWLTYQFQPANSGGPVPEIRQIAYDGVQLDPANYANPIFGQSQQFTIDPGGRIDILVKASGNGQANLVFTPVHGQPAPSNTLLTVNVSGPVVNGMNFPDQNSFPKMPIWLTWDENDPRNKIVGTRNLAFDREPNDVSRPSINGVAFDDEVSQTPLLHTAEQWQLANLWDDSIHTFHIHVNPFQVLEIYDPQAQQQVKLNPPYIWRDTVTIPAKSQNGTDLGRVKIRTRYTDFTGAFVLHCHLLDHEDRGMMEAVEIVDPRIPKTEKLFHR
jgi:FtsP/CotA-like multicopper oxidase with cupredoxin domain